MLDLNEATRIIKRNLPQGSIQAHIIYKDLFVFQVFGDDPLEGQWDPFYSVNRHTGEFLEFSIVTDGDPAEIANLFEEAQKGRKQ